MKNKKTREEIESAAAKSSSIAAIPTLDKRWIRAEKAFMDVCNIPEVDPALIHRHAYMVRRLVVELVNKLEYLTKLLGESHEK